MGRLNAKERNALPSTAFAGPGRTYPIEDRGHAIAAKSEAAQHASPAVRKKVDAAADRVLGKSDKPVARSVMGKH